MKGPCLILGVALLLYSGGPRPASSQGVVEYYNFFEYPTQTKVKKFDDVFPFVWRNALRILQIRNVSLALESFLKEPHASPLYLEYEKRVERLIGALPPPWEFSREGIFNVVVQAYHSRIINDRAVYQTRKYGQNLTDEEENARHHQRRIKMKFADSQEKCRWYLEQKRSYWKNSSLTFGAVRNHLYSYLDNTKIIPECFIHKAKEVDFAEDILKAYNAALFITLLQIDLMNDFGRYSVNGRKPRWEAPFGPLHRMLKDTDESLNAIEAGLKELRERLEKAQATQPNAVPYWQGVLKTFETTLKSDPYKELYGGGTLTKSTEIIDSARKVWVEFKKATVKFREYRPYFQYYKYRFKDYKSDFTLEELDQFYHLVVSVYDKYLHVGRVGNCSKKNIICDKDWAFDLSKPLQKLRVGWDYLDRVAEEMKCHLRKTYWFDLRNETLAKTQTQVKKGRIFGHFSRTLYQPCRDNDTDLVAQCNPVNYEICMPSFPTTQQEKYIQLTGDLSIYRPKWIFRRTETDPPGIGSICEGEKTFIIPLKLCRCGFIDDCARDIGEELTCPLQENDNIRKQCKGSVGYPCKTLPFAPGRHDASCVTGFCDMTMNSCEWNDDPQL